MPESKFPKMTLSIQGYQSIKDPISLEVEGLTVLLGESNQGKSAFVRAASALLDNERGSDFISVDRDGVSVSLTVNEHTATWTKGRKHGTSYEIDGVSHVKAGRSTPSELRSLGFYEIPAADRSYRPQIRGQFDGPFIIGESSPIAAAELLTASKGSQLLGKGVKISQKWSNTQASELSVRETDLAVLKRRLERALPHVALVSDGWAALEEAEAHKVSSEERFQQLQELSQGYEKQANQHRILDAVGEENLVPVPRVDLLASLRRLFTRYIEVESCIDLDIPLLPDYPKPDYVRCQTLQELENKISVALVIIQSLNDLTEPPQSPSLPPLEDLWSLENQYYYVTKDLALNTSELEIVEDEQRQNQEELERVLKILGKCPTCGESQVDSGSEHLHGYPLKEN